MTPDAKKLTLVERVGGVFLGVIALLVILVFLLPFVVGGNVRVIFQLGTALLVGWFRFCERTLAAIEWSWPLVVFWGVCLLLIGIGLNRLLKWFSGFVTEKRGKSFIWPTRWTWCGLVAVGMFFAVGMSVGGVLHQLGWMAKSDESLVKVYGASPLSHMMQLDGAFQQALLESKGDLKQARLSIWDSNTRYLKAPDWTRKRYRLFVQCGADGKVIGNIIFPISQEDFLNAGGLAYIEGETEGGFLPAEKIKRLFHIHQKSLIEW